ncbi:MAG: hypothetical protein COA43_13510 [Robiginitomaculum sp.]|nr:MAG: hypothetical protein COA43_13510 [Robiginitomaculum sp.]
MIKRIVYFAGDMIHTPWSKNAFLTEYSIEITSTPEDADFFLARSKQDYSPELLAMKKPNVIWTHEPMLDRSHEFIVHEEGNVFVIFNMFTRNIYVDNFFYGPGSLIEPVTSQTLNVPFKNRMVGLLSTNRETTRMVNGKDLSLDTIRSKLALNLHKEGMAEIMGLGWPEGVALGETRRKNNWGVSKQDFLKNYNFSLCMENTCARGYVSEKLWQSIEGHCLPIYYDNGSIYETFPQDSFLDFKHMEDYNELISTINNMSEEEYLERLNMCIRVYNKAVVIDGGINSEKASWKAIGTYLSAIDFIGRSLKGDIQVGVIAQPESPKETETEEMAEALPLVDNTVKMAALTPEGVIKWLDKDRPTVHFLGPMTYTPWVDGEFLDYANLHVADTPEEADFLVARERKCFTPDILKLHRPNVIWTHEPFLELSDEFIVEDDGAQFMIFSMYTRNIYIDNFRYAPTSRMEHVTVETLNTDFANKKVGVLSTFRETSRVIGGKERSLDNVRSHLALDLHKLDMADIVGRAWPDGVAGTSTRDRNWAGEKQIFLKDYNFCLCMENTCYEGYTSEKLWHSIEAHCLPIYYDTGSIYHTFPTDSFLDFSKMAGVDELSHMIRNMPIEEYVSRLNACIDVYNQAVDLDMKEKSKFLTWDSIVMHLPMIKLMCAAYTPAK